jgi:hypothetical protein
MSHGKDGLICAETAMPGLLPVPSTFGPIVLVRCQRMTGPFEVIGKGKRDGPLEGALNNC